MAGSFKPVVQQMQAALAEDANRDQTQFLVNTRQVDGLCSEATARQFTQTIDEPEAVGGSDCGPSPVEVALASLGSCHEVTYRMCADELDIPLDGISVKLTGNIDFQGFFWGRRRGSSGLWRRGRGGNAPVGCGRGRA